eukprot:7704633-Karenia_brevis.AAC.1
MVFTITTPKDARPRFLSTPSASDPSPRQGFGQNEGKVSPIGPSHNFLEDIFPQNGSDFLRVAGKVLERTTIKEPNIVPIKEL